MTNFTFALVHDAQSGEEVLAVPGWLSAVERKAPKRKSWNKELRGTSLVEVPRRKARFGQGSR